MRQLILNASALQHNLDVVRKCAPHSKILAMVKANAYGHGLAWAAHVLADAGVDGLGVAIFEEAVQLREAGFQGMILITNGVQSFNQLEKAAELECSLVVHQACQLEWLERLHSKTKVSIWLKVDTGMHRLGFPPQEAVKAYQRLMNLSHVEKPLVLMTHFSDADDTHKNKTREQIACFQKVYDQLSPKPLRSLANSAGIVAWPESHGDWVRPGIVLYGDLEIDGFAYDKTLDLKPVMTVKSNIISLHDYPKGEALGYGETFVCPHLMRVGVVAFGYGDGYPRSSYQSEVLIRGKKISVIARISMDMLQVDLTEHPDVQLGDEVTLWGDGLGASQLARAAQTISYEIFCQLQRERIHVKEE